MADGVNLAMMRDMLGADRPLRPTNNATNAARSSTLVRLCLCDAFLERLAHCRKDMPRELGQRIRKYNPMIRQRYLARQRHLAPADQANVGDRTVRGAAGTGRPSGVRPPASRRRCGCAWSR
jgi:hypothetical protein